MAAQGSNAALVRSDPAALNAAKAAKTREVANCILATLGTVHKSSTRCRFHRCFIVTKGITKALVMIMHTTFVVLPSFVSMQMERPRTRGTVRAECDSVNVEV